MKLTKHGLQNCLFKTTKPYFICKRISSVQIKRAASRFKQYLFTWCRQVVSIYIVNRFESPYDMVLIQLPSLIQLAQYRSKKHNFYLFTGSHCFFFFFFFFFALFLMNLDFISIGPQESIYKKRTNEANLVETKNHLLISYRHRKSPLRLKQMNFFAAVLVKCREHEPDLMTPISETPAR